MLTGTDIQVAICTIWFKNQKKRFENVNHKDLVNGDKEMA